jgi:type VI secretion system protein ImpL
MYQLRNFLTDSRFLSFIGVAAVATFFSGAKTLQIAMLWAAMASLAILILWGSVWFYRRRKSRRASEAIGSMLEQQADTAVKRGSVTAEIQALRAHAGSGQDHQDIEARPDVGCRSTV